MSLVRVSLEGHVATVTLSRPEAMNALSGEMADQVAGALLRAAADPEAWVVVLAAEGEKAFCVGADLKERNRLDDAGWLRNRILIRSMFDTLRALPQPSIAAVFGFALDRGFELPLEDGLELEDLAWRRAVASEDRPEGIAAFNDKRDPQWKGR